MIEPEAVGNPHTHTFANGVTYTFSELSIRKQGQVVSWLRTRKQSMALDAVGGLMATDKDREMALRVGLKPIDPEELNAELNDLPVMLRVLWLASDASSRTPPIDDEQFAESLGNVSVDELIVLLRIAQGITTNPEDAESSPNSTGTTGKAESLSS